MVGLNLELVDYDGSSVIHIVDGGIVLGIGALASETVHGGSKAVQTKSILSVESELHVTESVFSEGTSSLQQTTVTL